MRRKTVKTIAIVIVIAMVVTSFSFLVFLPGAYGAEALPTTTAEEQKYLNQKLKELENYLKFIRAYHMDFVDYETLIEGAFEGAMYSLEDPYSVYFRDKEEGERFLESATGDYSGVGVVLSPDISGICEIIKVIPDAPAQKAGILAGDVFLKINGEDVTSLFSTDIANLLRGEKGTKVTITVSRAGKELSFTMTREAIHYVNIDHKMIEGDIGYISMLGFESAGGDAFKKAKADLIKSGAKSLIVDIRDNPGGLLSTAIEIANEFVESGDILHYKFKGQIIDSVRATGRKTEKLPTVLLINGNSASASEILAGALKDNKAAILVGETTYGKGTAQMMEKTSGGQLFKLSMEYFLTPSKNDIHEVGVSPDHVVRNSLGEFNRNALELYLGFAPFAEDKKPKPGEVGINVYAAQQRLSLLGFTPGFSAVMDEATVAAVKSFQSEQGLYAYGTLDLTTMRRIEEVTRAYVNNDSTEDLQLKKAIELLKQ